MGVGRVCLTSWIRPLVSSAPIQTIAEVTHLAVFKTALVVGVARPVELTTHPFAPNRTSAESWMRQKSACVSPQVIVRLWPAVRLRLTVARVGVCLPILVADA